ncbi:MAG: N-acetylornithine carbamoyltransferase [Gammaproteobacteria bacterium]|jgi:N-acetylornithine carbamoyltransferase|nr:acetylornithine carbamoyltransferase [Chromatiales bacterium]MDP6675163.1 N-acetylornithine carbamoyltransferase [Gammaproteobacteria bacterium]
MKEFNDLADLNGEQVKELLALANRLQTNPEPRALEGKVLALLFMSPSLRTLASFQAAMVRLGGGSFVISPDMSIHGIETRPGIVMDGVAAEHIREAVPVIASYADAIGIRAFAERRNLDHDLDDREFNNMREYCQVPLINMESAINHPCQSLADWKTMDDLSVPGNGGKFVLSWAYHPRVLPLAVPSATVHMAAMRGMDVTVLRPEGFELPASIMDKARQAAQLSGGSVNETNNRDEALEDAQIIYAKSWASTQHYGNRVADEEQRRDLNDWCVDESWFAATQDNCRFMHCLPVRRGVVVSDQVLDGPRSVVIQEAQNRMYAQMAVLHQILAST